MLQQAKEEQDLLGNEDDEEVEKIENASWNASKAVLLLLLGTAIAVAFAHPFVDSINSFSTATSIPPFFVGFIVLPFVRSSEGLSALIFAGRKKQRTASLTFSQVKDPRQYLKNLSGFALSSLVCTNLQSVS
jgi:Ca2+/H+ antiporter